MQEDKEDGDEDGYDEDEDDDEEEEEEEDEEDEDGEDADLLENIDSDLCLLSPEFLLAQARTRSLWHDPFLRQAHPAACRACTVTRVSGTLHECLSSSHCAS